MGQDMEQPTGRRKLAAILMADVVEYGRHMGDDESATIGTLKAHRAVFSKTIQQRSGRVVDSKGDGAGRPAPATAGAPSGGGGTDHPPVDESDITF